MKVLLVVFSVLGMMSATLPVLAETDSTADAAWSGYFDSLKAAVKTHDTVALKKLIASDIEYEDGVVSDTRFIEDFSDEHSGLTNAVVRGQVSGNGRKRLLKSEAGDIEFVFAKGKWYLKAFNVGG